MYIEKLYIESFGKINDKEIVFSRGLNVIEGSNESGKTTLCMFIKFMLYGLSGRGADGEMAERQKYVSWDTGKASGNMTVVTARGTFCIERSLEVGDNLSQPRERVEVTDLDSGERVFKGKVPGVEILGIDEKMFINTVFVRQVGSAAIDGSGMTEAIENILLSGDENVSLKKAMDRLDKARKALMHKRGTGGALHHALVEKARLEKELSDSRDGNAKMIALENEAEKTETLIASRTREKEENAALYDAYLKISAGKRVMKALELQKKIDELSKKLSILEKYGSISERTGNINAHFARLSGVDAKLSALRRSIGGEPDERDYMPREDMLLSGEDSKRATALKKSRGRNACLFAVMFVLAALVLAASFVLRLSLSGNMFYIAVAAGAFLAVLGAVFAVMTFVNSSKLSAICKRWNLSSKKNMEKELTEKIARAHAYNEASNELSKKRLEIGECEAEREDIISVLRRESSVFVNEETVDTDILVAKALEKAEEISREREELRGEMGVLRGEYRSFADYLGDDGGRAVLSEAERVMNTDAGKTALGFDKKYAETVKGKMEFAQSVLPGLIARKGETEASLARLRATTKDLGILAAQLDATVRDTDGMKRRLSAIETALEALRKAGEGLRTSVIPYAVEKAGEYMDSFTDGKYDELILEPDFSVGFRIGDKKRDISYMSAGTADGAYISLRIALSEVLFPADPVVLIYDESFARVDEKRLSEILMMLSKGKMQSLVFTCRTLEGAVAEKLEGSSKINL